jgi:hypothetical protein
LNLYATFHLGDGLVITAYRPAKAPAFGRVGIGYFGFSHPAPASTDRTDQLKDLGGFGNRAAALELTVPVTLMLVEQAT